jgi:isoleucyl-tRNA synthetase
MPYSTGCTTPLANFEASQNYREVTDPAVIVSFPLDEDPNVKIIAWTTTPWTLPSNLALCVHPELIYVKVQVGVLKILSFSSLLSYNFTTKWSYGKFNGTFNLFMNRLYRAH